MSFIRRIVVVSNNADVQQLAKQVSQDIYLADDPAEALDITETANPDLIVFDDRFSPSHIREFLDKTYKNSICTPVIVISTNENDIEANDEFIQAGAYAYVKGKQNYHQLEQIVLQTKKKFNGGTVEKNVSYFFVDDYAASIPIVGKSKAIRANLRMLKLIASSQCNPILIIGETGTGKELAAKAIHNIRHLKEQFVAINCAALTATLLESELFGHVKGSFTGADRDKIGLLELAGSGTIFLDEISEMPLDLQAKLLRVLQEKTFRKVGGIKKNTCNATIIASSNRNLKLEIQNNRFRRDLYYRISICPITMAPLRSPGRREDIRILAEYFLDTSTICLEKRNKIKCLTELAIENLEKYNWPGNVRELRNVIERAILLETTDKIGLSSIIFEPIEFEQPQQCHTPTQVKDFSLAKAERELIARALQETGWQKTQAAGLLGITRATLYAKVKQYNIEKEAFDAKKSQPEGLDRTGRRPALSTADLVGPAFGGQQKDSADHKLKYEHPISPTSSQTQPITVS